VSSHKNSEPCNAAGRPAGKSGYTPVRVAQRPFCKLRLSDGHAVRLRKIFVFKSDDDVSAIVCRADHTSRSSNLDHDITLFFSVFRFLFSDTSLGRAGRIRDAPI
jgi:hypothetical protein